MTDLNNYFYTDGVDDVLAVYVNRLLAASLRAEYRNVETLSADKTLTDADTPIQVQTASGANRNVTLPAVGSENHVFLAVNAGVSNNLVYKDAGGNGITIITPRSAQLILPSGEGWYSSAVIPSQSPFSATRYLGQDGQYHDIPTAISLFASNTASDITNYKSLSTTVPTGSVANTATSIPAADTVVEEFFAAAGVFDFVSGQVLHCHTHLAKTAGSKNATAYIKVFHRTSGGVETLLGTSEVSANLAGSNSEYDFSITVADTIFAATDRLGYKIFASPVGAGTDPTVTTYYEGTTGARLEVGASLLSSGGGGSGATPHAPGCRLSLESGVLVSITKQLAKTSVYCVPGPSGDLMPLWDGTKLNEVTFPEVSIALNSTPHPANSNHDVFAFMDGTTKRIGTVKWRNSGQAITAATNANPCVITANSHGIQNGDMVDVYLKFANTEYIGQYAASSVATNTITFTAINSTSDGALLAGYINCRGVGSGTSELERVNGILVNKNAITAYYSASSASVAARYGTYLGSIRITSVAGQCEVSTLRQFIWNYYNRRLVDLDVIEATDTWAYTTNTIRQANGSTANKVELIIGISEDAVSAKVDGVVYLQANVTYAAKTAAGIDSTSVFNGHVMGGYNTAGSAVYAPVGGEWAGYLPAGYHFISWNEKGPDGTCLFVGDKGGDGQQAGMSVKVWA